jgi:uncharacterized repeat protein (TIGR03803 family)
MPEKRSPSLANHTISMFLALLIPMLAVVVAPPAQGQNFTVLHTFTSGAADGQDPLHGSLILDTAGNLYGATSLGGSGACNGGCGVVFKLDKSGTFTVLYAFTGTGSDGKYPYGSLIRDNAGNFYGTTFGGGTSGAACNGYGCGTVYKLDPAGHETVLYSFTGGVDGATPEAGLVQDAAGNLYGTTDLGGAYNWGTVFKVDPSGNETVLHDFDGLTGDGGDVMGGLISDSAGNLYGTTQGGGTSGCLPGFNMGCGTVFEVAPDGTETVLYRFPYPNTEGEWPGEERLLRDYAGNLYGVTQGSYLAGGGKIFRLDPSGNFKVLHTFTGGAGGQNPWAGVISDPQGNIYGTTPEGGGTKCNYGCGTVFKLSPTGKFKVLHQFTGWGDGGIPFSGLVRDASGNLYGMTLVGGVGDGVIFKITP